MNASSRVSDACQPILRRRRPISKPGVPTGTMNAEICPSGVRAVAIASSEMSVPALVMNIFEPLMT